ncbi:hypothetical protein C9374_004537 [Naegleria lovaniensis]|uniref:Uncharacterized protein n=1 Tax=Naegleria lovaniensis TaxID=51637 RepID=A0AA88GMR8_NAELO|nr:uncharacterized protein C9374_004537 [Naegleria lovaniensis]KAG2383200.1 hypothetical protein C9374_004537 [Naegleria lovaniensis]
MVLYRYGSLARAGKVKFQTPRVPKDDETNHKYNGGQKKLREHSKNNKKYKSGANRWISEQISTDPSSCTTEPQAPYNYVSNSLHKFNTLEGLSRLEFKWTNIQNKRLQLKAEAYYDRNNKNHKKWHRNHPKDGFYQFRHVFDEV